MNETGDARFSLPDLLLRQLIRRGFRWEYAREVTMPEFLSRYSLHDSEWVAFWLDPMYGDGTAVIRWDMFWAKEFLAHLDGEPGEWPFLVLRFPTVYRVEWANLQSPDDYLDYISAAVSEEITDEERSNLLALAEQQPWLRDDGLEHLSTQILYRTVIVCSSDAPLRIVHQGAVQILCFTAAGEPFQLPGR